jgi:DHA1 family tetracycline resistance protein-like MFS transporter
MIPAGQSRNTTLFLLLTAFLNMAGVGIIAPVLPFITGKYVADGDVIVAGSLLFTSFSFFQFLATPTLGALSDRYGRRPVLLVSLLGSAFGYLLLGIGGSIAMLFAGRIIDGITGGNIATIYAYAADITEPKNRTRFFGMLGSVAGLGFLFGPLTGFVAYRLAGTYEAPLFIAALLTLANAAWGYYVMPESLSAERRDKQITLNRLNPLTQLLNIFSIQQLRLLLIGVLLWSIAFAALQSNLGFLAEDRLQWQPDQTNMVFFIVGLVGIITQGGVVRYLLPILGEARMAMFGLISMLVGFLIISLVDATLYSAFIIIGVIPVAFGNGLIIPSLNGLFSSLVSATEQGRIQGGNQSIQALGRVIGPLWGGWIYTIISPSAPYLSGAVLLLSGALTIFYVLRTALKPAPSPATD